MPPKNTHIHDTSSLHGLNLFMKQHNKVHYHRPGLLDPHLWPIAVTNGHRSASLCSVSPFRETSKWLGLHSDLC